MKLIINRQKWIRGENESCLYRPNDGKMCCLGFLAIQSGASISDIDYLPDPAHCSTSVNWPFGILNEEYLNSDLCNELILINDEKLSSDKTKEKVLKTKFAQINIDVEFIE